MRSTMMDVPLQVRRLLEHGTTVHASSRVITAAGDGSQIRTATFTEIGLAAARLAGALRRLGIGPGERVATFMWNNAEHLVAYLAVPAMGAVVHPLNIRLFPEQLVFIGNHAEDRVVIVDHTLLPGFVKLLPKLATVEHVIVNGPADMSLLDGAAVSGHAYADLLASAPDSYDWPELDERQAAAMCYTSGTTGNPKGVVYSHRSIYLHSLGSALPDALALTATDRMLTVVPQFHVLAWGLPYTAMFVGASLAMPDRFLAPEPLAAFIEAARPTRGAGVPTVWAGLLRHVEASPEADISSLREIIVGGAACPPALMEGYDRLGITAVHAWGMTEMSPLGTQARPPAGVEGEQLMDYRLSQGRFVGPVEARLVGPAAKSDASAAARSAGLRSGPGQGAGEVLPWDGESVGELEVRGPWVTGSYYRDDDPDRFHEGWLRTGDVGTITPDGFLRLTDRAKDVIKSGGEWISSVELEGHLMAHPAVAEASVIGVPDDRWGERPLGVVVVQEGESVTAAELRSFLSERVARWQLPERWAFTPEIPKTSVGKFDKKVLRQSYAGDELDVVRAD